MNAEEVLLNIAVNLGRLANWVNEQRLTRVDFFLSETTEYLEQLEHTQINPRFVPTYQKFCSEFQRLKNASLKDEAWAEDALTWANILTHRAKLA